MSALRLFQAAYASLSVIRRGHGVSRRHEQDHGNQPAGTEEGGAGRLRTPGRFVSPLAT